MSSTSPSGRTRKERMALPRVEPREHDATERAASFCEVDLGLDWEGAQLEADRCLQCVRPRCIEGCPVGIRIDEFLGKVAEGDIDGAAQIIFDDSSLPAVCGRVCPQESQCEATCVLAKKDKPIAIGQLERYVADAARAHAPPAQRVTPDPDGGSAAIVGSGPAGLACAADLAQAGHDVTVYEALHDLGGVLAYGIPQFRLPRDVLRAEINRLAELGVRFETNAPIGQAEGVDDLLAEHDAVFLGVGAGVPRFLNVPGEDLVGVSSANEFLTRVNLMEAHRPDADTPLPHVAGRRVLVFGGGNTAIDAVRTALRLGAAKATICYRRSEEQMPARVEEIRHAREEGAQFALLTNPVELLDDGTGALAGARLQRMELVEPDDGGRARPKPIPGSEHEVPADLAVVAVGNEPNPLLRRAAPDLERTSRGTIAVDEETGATSKPRVYAGGDIVTGGATVILAMGAGRRAAASMDREIRAAKSGAA